MAPHLVYVHLSPAALNREANPTASDQKLLLYKSSGVSGRGLRCTPSLRAGLVHHKHLALVGLADVDVAQVLSRNCVVLCGLWIRNYASIPLVAVAALDGIRKRPRGAALLLPGLHVGFSGALKV